MEAFDCMAVTDTVAIPENSMDADMDVAMGSKMVAVLMAMTAFLETVAQQIEANMAHFSAYFGQN